MNFREEIRELRGSTFNEDTCQDIFDKHMEAWHAIEDAPRIWTFLGLDLEEYSNMVGPGDGLEQFYNKVCQEG